MARPTKQWMARQTNPDQLKLYLCEYISRSMMYSGLSQRALAQTLGTSQANLCRVNCKRVEQLTFNQLFRYLLALEPRAKIMISAL